MTTALGKAGIGYMLTGSFASSYHGLPRTTQDIDIVISPTADQLRILVSFLPTTEYYFDLSAALDAQRREGMFNVLDLATGWKTDFIIRKSRPFSRTEFDRRISAEVQGIQLFIATAEDVVIAKLEWAKRGGSQRQIEDAGGILRIRGAHLDTAYIENWVRELGLVEQWTSAKQAGKGSA
ncbi:MAG: hypothetical protein ACREMY_30555 [bacterium]